MLIILCRVAMRFCGTSGAEGAEGHICQTSSRARRYHRVLELFDTVWNNGTTTFFLLLNSYPVKEGPGSDCVGVKIGNAHRLADDAGCHGREWLLAPQVGGAFEEVRPITHALPGHRYPQGVRRQGRQPQNRKSVRGDRPANPFLPIVHPVGICVDIVYRPVGRKAVLLKPRCK